MPRLALPGAVLAVTLAAVATTARTAPLKDSPSFNYQLHCSGCHKQDGSGQGRFVPTFLGEVGQFLGSGEGRAFLVRVPGVAQSELDNRQIAELMNWLVREFDPKNVPASFKPYTAQEVGTLRRHPISDAARHRARILAESSMQQNPKRTN